MAREDSARIILGDDIPRSIGRYRLCCELATGGMATVYLAKVEGPGGFDKLVALKRVHPHLRGDKKFVEMFLDEARIAARINHPNVCSVFDFGEARNSHFIAMEYLFGESLLRMMKRVASRPEVATSQHYFTCIARVMADACEGLHAAHETRDDDGELLDVVHRDVSPQNLFITYDGVVKVVDFGIARAADRIHQTQTDTVKGKYAYMAPEQLRKKGVDRRADVWSLGVVMWEMLTLKRLFRRASQPDTLMAVLDGDVTPPRDLRPEVPEELEKICLRALSPERDDRYPTSRDLARALTKFNRSREQPVGMPELAEFMQELFERDYATKQEMIRAARKISDHELPSLASLSGEASDTGLSVPDMPPPPRSPSIFDHRAFVRPKKWLRNRRVRTWGAVGLGLSLLLMGIALGSGLSGGGDEEELADGRQLAAEPPAPVPALEEAPEPIPAPEPEPPPVTTAMSPPPAVEPEVAAPPPMEVTTPSAEEPTETGVEAEVSAEAEAESEAETELESPAEMIERPRMRRPTTAGPPGQVTVVTPGGWADIYVAGRRVGRTPDTITLPPGRHVIELRPRGRLPARRTSVNVRSGQPARAVVRLD